MTDVNSLSQEEAIAQLKKTISQLKTIVEQLGDTSVIDLPSSNSIQSLKATATELESLIASKTATQNELEPEPESTESEPESEPQAESTSSEFEPATAPAETSPEKPKDKKIVSEEKTKVTPVKKAAQSKPVKPKTAAKPEPSESPTKPQKKWLVPGVIALVLAIAIPLSWYLFANNQDELVAIKKQDLDLPIVEMPVDATDETTEPAAKDLATEQSSNDIAAAENLAPEVSNSLEPEIDIASEPETIEVPAELSSTSRPKKVAIETIPPQLKLTPDQNFIATLNTKIANLDRSQDELVAMVTPDLEADLVTVTLTDDWYEISTNRQDKLLSDLFKRSRQLKFTQLKIADSQQNLIARSPVVGKEMVVLRRTS